MNNTETIHLLEDLVRTFAASILGEQTDTMTTDSLLQLMITDSRHAIDFIVLLEDEFDIEIDDDDISLAFFESVETVAESVNNALLKQDTSSD